MCHKLVHLQEDKGAIWGVTPEKPGEGKCLRLIEGRHEKDEWKVSTDQDHLKN